MLELCPGGPDVCVDATGFRYAKEILHKVERFLRLETDAKSAIIEAIYLVKKFGHISVIGELLRTDQSFPHRRSLRQRDHLSCRCRLCPEVLETTVEIRRRG